LGYNRRAKYLWQAAQKIMSDFSGEFPCSLAELTSLPGVGRNTAGAVLTYAFNEPIVFIETNIRSVYFYHFFADRTDIKDCELLPLIEQTLDVKQPREFYWSLMDYGTYLKAQKFGQIKHSKHYTKQSKFEGSARQLRGKALRLLTDGPLAEKRLLAELADDRATTVLAQLSDEGFVVKRGRSFRLA
jgi:A/G-specific adenine glycosylase